MQHKTGYANLPRKYRTFSNSLVAVLPVAYDATSTWIKGADKGPQALLEASANMELYDIETDCEVYKKGIYTEAVLKPPSPPRKMIQTVKNKVRRFLEHEKFVVVIGGEHSVAVPSIAAHAQTFTNLSILQLDAHADLRQQYHRSAYNHACVGARAREIAPTVQVGIRSMDREETKHLDPQTTFFAADIHHAAGWQEKVVSTLSQNVYLTVDLDVFDPAIMPSTGTPEPGGLRWYQTLELLKNLCKNRNLVGLDVTELCPNKTNKAPDFLAAKLVYKILSYKFGA